MGNAQGFQHQYAVPVAGTETPNTTPILRAPTHPDELLSHFSDENINSSWHLFLRGKSTNNGKNPCLGYRTRSNTGEVAADFTWMSYNDVENAVVAFGSGLLNLPDCMPVIEYEDEEYTEARQMKMLGVFSKNRVEWLISEQTCNAYGFSLVPLYDTLGQEALEFILDRTRMSTVVCSLECLPVLMKGIEATKHVKYIVTLVDAHETIPAELRQQMDALNIKCIDYKDIVASPGKLHPVCPGALSTINTVCFTSGTTGNPKGVLLTHGNVVSCIAGMIRGPLTNDFNITTTDIYISYLPLAHVLERFVCNCFIALGACIGTYSGDATKLLEDVRCLRPTIFVSVPRLFNRINDAVFRGVTEKSTVARYFFERGMSSKLNTLRTNAATTNSVWDPLVFNKTRALMGNRLRYMISGGAPLDAVVQEHMKVLFCSPLMEGYGMTETFGPAFLANSKDPVSGHVGGIVPCNEFRLKSVQEMNYNVTDFPPRGELQIRGNAITVGYFRDPNETSASLDSEGWLSTGDIAVLLPGGGLKIIDRKKNIFKLAQGEYVAPEKIEGVYLQAPLITQAFVFGYSDKPSLVAIMVPDPEVLKSWASKQGCFNGGESIAELCKCDKLKDDMLKEMETAAKECQLKGFEKVRDIFVHSEPFSVEDGLLTPTLKIKRHQAKQMFQTQIDEMYSQMK